MSFIEQFPTSGWKNQNLKECVQKLIQMEADFDDKKAKSTLASIMLSLGNVFKEDASQISKILSRPAVNTARASVRKIDPNPTGQYDNINCDTCPGAKVVTIRNSKVEPLVNPAVLQDTSVPSNTDPSAGEINTILSQVEGEQTLIVSKEHDKPTFGSPEEVWKYFSGDLAKLQEAAVAVGIKNAKYDQVPMSLAKKIYNAQ